MGDKMELVIYADNLIEGEWFRSLSPLLLHAGFQRIKGRGENPAVIDDLIKYDRPDIILTLDDEPVLVLEKTREVPTGHNVGQRIARLVRAAENGIPTIEFFPFDAMKHGDYAGKCNLNIRLLKAFDRMSEIHDIPVLAVNWPCDGDAELIDDGTENTVVAMLVQRYIESRFDPTIAEFVKQKEQMELEYERRMKNHPSYADPPPSVKIIPTSDFQSDYEAILEKGINKKFTMREETLIYEIGMTPTKCRREDPYTGMQFIYDYIWCRNGPGVADKQRNLVLWFPDLDRGTWTAANPNDDSRKSSNWYLTANTLLFKDGATFLR
jgi:hypothetical protein